MTQSGHAGFRIAAEQPASEPIPTGAPAAIWIGCIAVNALWLTSRNHRLMPVPGAFWRAGIDNFSAFNRGIESGFARQLRQDAEIIVVDNADFELASLNAAADLRCSELAHWN